MCDGEGYSSGGAVTRTGPKQQETFRGTRKKIGRLGGLSITPRTSRVAMSAAFNALYTRKLWHGATALLLPLVISLPIFQSPSQLSFPLRHYTTKEQNNDTHAASPEEHAALF